MAASSYPSPVDKFLTYGDISEMQEVPNYVEELGFSADHIPDLIRMATDKELNSADTESLEVWAPIHAVRVLGQLRASEAIPPLINLFHELDDDWMGSELPDVFGMIGPAAIPALEAYVADSSHESFERTDAATALTRIAQNHPDVRDQCVTILTNLLERFAENDPDMNACLIGELVDLKAIESAPVIERAFAANRVVPFLVGDWGEVQVSLGLKTREEVPLRRFSLEEISDYYGLGLVRKPRGFATTASTPSKNKKKSNKKSNKRK